MSVKSWVLAPAELVAVNFNGKLRPTSVFEAVPAKVAVPLAPAANVIPVGN